MSDQTRTGEVAEPAGRRARSRPLDVIGCDGCGRHFSTDDGPAMVAAIKGPCPGCGGRFQMMVADAD